jgi:phosphoglycolate phosphatase-like HAD superfamily hydrolase
MHTIQELPDIKVVLFDKDGTLTDNAKQIYDAIKFIIEHYQDDAPSFLEVWESYTPPLFDYLAQFGVPKDDHEIVEALFYEAMDYQSTTIFSDAYPVLKELHARNIVTGVISSNITEQVQVDCARGGIVEHLDFIRGSLTCKAEAITTVCRERRVVPSEVAYVGDMAFDVHDAKKAGAVSVAVTRQHNTEKMFKDIGADYCLEGLSELFTCGLLPKEHITPKYELIVGTYSKKGGSTGKKLTLYELADDGRKIKCFNGFCRTVADIQKTLPIQVPTGILVNGKCTTFIPK